MQKMNTLNARRMHSLQGGYLPSQCIILGSENSSDFFPFLLHEVVVRISLQAGFFYQSGQYTNMMLLDSCLKVTLLSQFVVVNPRNTVLGIISLGLLNPLSRCTGAVTILAVLRTCCKKQFVGL